MLRALRPIQIQVKLEPLPVLWNMFLMKLTADRLGRLGSTGLFRPQTDFEATVQTDGSVHLVELSQVPVLKPRWVGDRLHGADLC